MGNQPPILNRRKKGIVSFLLRLVLFGVFFFGIAGGITGLWILEKYRADLPPLPEMEVAPPAEVSTIRAADGQVLGTYSDNWKKPLPYDSIPRTLLLAFLATEDSRFFAHQGIDFRGIFRAFVTNIRAGNVVQGGSTITQQLAKSLLSTEKTLDRKIKEALLSVQIEAKYSKEEIILLYLNSIYLGNGANGIQAASLHYFHRPVWELSLGEMTLLAGLPQAPSRYDPTRHPERAQKRRETVLNRMVARGYIPREAADKANEEPIRVFRRKSLRHSIAPFCAEAARQELVRKYGKDWFTQGWTVHTTCDVSRTRLAQKALQTGLEILDRRQGWRGPLARGSSPEDASEVWKERGGFNPEKNPMLAFVSTVTDEIAHVALDDTLTVELHLRDHRWAAPYTEFPLLEGAKGKTVRSRSGRVSLDGKLKSLTDALQPGDWVMVEQSKEGDKTHYRLAQLPAVEGAFLGLDRFTGHPVALVGGYDYGKSQVNRVYSLRQTGSLMKPLIYALAYRMGLPASALFSGAPFFEGSYNPTGKKAEKDTTAWEGLARSLNSISLRVHRFVLETGGLDAYKNWGRQLGLSQPLQGYTSEVLGTEQTLWDMVHAFGSMSRAGTELESPLIRSIKDSEGATLFSSYHPLDPTMNLDELLASLGEKQQPQSENPPADAEALYIAAANLAEVTRTGTGRKARRELNFPTAGKTGTLPYDVWFVGWSPEFLAGAWVGADRRNRVLGRSEKKNIVHGGNTALPIWIEWMKGAQPTEADSPLLPAPPSGIEFPKIDLATGWLDPDSGVEIPHRAGTVPTRLRPLPTPKEESPSAPILPMDSATQEPPAEPAAPPKPSNVPPTEIEAMPTNSPATPRLPSQPESLDDILD